MALPLSYNWRNLFVRKLSTALTFSVIAVIVAVLAVLLSFATGIRDSLKSTGSPENVIALRRGATAESTSIINPEEANRLYQTPGIARDRRGQPLVSQELCVQTSIPRRGPEGNLANVAVRGVDDIAFDVHPEVRIVEGTKFEQGSLQIIVGRQASQRYRNLQVGDTIEMGRAGDRAHNVVGIFEAGGGALESEIWAGRTQIADSYNRRSVCSVYVRLKDAADVPAAIDYIKGPAVRLIAKTELEYYADLSKKTREIVVLTTILITIMGIGATFAVANTMYASVDRRRREIAMLKTLGFSRSTIVTAFVLEALLISIPACIIGFATSLLMNGHKQDFLSDNTWTVLAYELKITPGIFLAALALSTLVGVIGSLSPALRASRIRAIEALRKA